MNNAFSKVPWISHSNVYEVNIRQYTNEGTFNAFEHHIDRLSDMGVDVLWFMPITPISINNRKGSLGSYYACSSYVNINPEYGTSADFKRIVDKAHSFGMKVIIDWVANHTGCDHHWTINCPSFYKIDSTGNFYDAHGWEDVIDLDYSNQEMRIEMISSMQYWIDQFDIDGFRCDMAMLTPVDFWMQARSVLDREKPHFWLAELDPIENPAYMEVFDSAYTWKWMNAVKYFKETGARNIAGLKSILFEYDNVLPSSVLPAWFTSNHDENSWNGTEYEKYGELSIPLAVFSSMWKGIHLIYSGQELPNYKRLLFFDKDQIEWKQEIALHDFYRTILSFKKNNHLFDMNSENSKIQFVSNNIEHHVLSFVRTNEDYDVLVIINFSEYELKDVEIDVRQITGHHRELFTGVSAFLTEQKIRFSLKAWGYQVWYK